jgi:putative hydrolase of the HAD superfamily
MKDHYKHIFFDLDHTLWDFEKSATETLRELYISFELATLGDFGVEEFCQAFHKVNYHLWYLHQKGTFDQATLRKERFKMIFSDLGISHAKMPLTIADAYLQLCPSKPHVFPYTHDVLNYLGKRYDLHIITNGFADVQWIKLRSAQLVSYFRYIVTSDDAGYRKPDSGIFRHTLTLIDAQPAECIMIGDNLDTDIAGAQHAEIDCVYFNPQKLSHQATTNYEISCLSELKGIL